MAAPKLSKLEFQIMEALWAGGERSIRAILDSMPGKRQPAYTTVQTTIYRMEGKGVVRRVRKVGNSHIFMASVSREAAQGRLIDDLLALLGGRPEPVLAHLIKTDKLTIEDVKEAEQALGPLSRAEKRSI